MLRVSFCFKLIFFIPIFFLFNIVLLSQESKTIFLKNADNLIGLEKNGEPIRELTGNVELSQGNIILKCDKALQYLNLNKVEVLGNVILYQDTFKLYTDNGIYLGDSRITFSPSKVRITDGLVDLKANSGKYDANKRIAFFFNDVVFNDKKNIIFSDTLFYFRDSLKILAFGNVKIISDENNTIYGDTLEHYRKTKHSILRGNPLLIRYDSIKHEDSNSVYYTIDTLFIKSKLLISTRDTQSIIIALDSVKTYRNDISLSCNKMTYFIQDSVFILEKDPAIWYQKSQIFSDSITLFLKNRSLQKLIASNNAFMLSEADSLISDLYNQVMGDTIIIYFSDNKPDSILSFQKAIAFYYQTDSLGINSGYKSSGDKIKIESTKRKLRAVKILYGVESFYYPRNMLVGREKEYNLPRFKILTNKPKREDYQKK